MPGDNDLNVMRELGMIEGTVEALKGQVKDTNASILRVEAKLDAQTGTFNAKLDAQTNELNSKLSNIQVTLAKGQGGLTVLQGLALLFGGLVVSLIAAALHIQLIGH